MRMPRVLATFAAAGGMLFSASAFAATISGPLDRIIPIDRDIPLSSSRYPTPGETPSNVRDGSLNKYLNFGDTPNVGVDNEAYTGFVITPGGGPSVVQSVQFTTANDAAERDPLTYTLYGTNDPITSADNS